MLLDTIGSRKGKRKGNPASVFSDNEVAPSSEQRQPPHVFWNYFHGSSRKNLKKPEVQSDARRRKPRLKQKSAPTSQRNETGENPAARVPPLPARAETDAAVDGGGERKQSDASSNHSEVSVKPFM